MTFLMSVSFNQLMTGLGQKPLYTYLIAGGDRSVVASREGKEDSTLHRIEELKKVAAGKKRVIVIGISAGLSVSTKIGGVDQFYREEGVGKDWQNTCGRNFHFSSFGSNCMNVSIGRRDPFS
ncbi:glucokinase regulatory protein-like [Heterocephalus glaber]|uniref:Glucokinase regulatory protein-like n=1 Tax=Heterocephalus glaber TaxID=10181 RepID=A0AAX6SI77_HETGA|nr:glucokinase regulatory protein-like [Heterocephalus glaber]